MATLTFYSDAHPETSSVDGVVTENQGGGVTWAALIVGAGTDFVDDGASGGIAFHPHADTNKWKQLDRGIFLFDTSGLPDDAVISSAILSL